VLCDVQEGEEMSTVDSSTDEPRTVLRVVIENMLYTVSLDILKQVDTDRYLCNMRGNRRP